MFPRRMLPNSSLCILVPLLPQGNDGCSLLCSGKSEMSSYQTHITIENTFSDGHWLTWYSGLQLYSLLYRINILCVVTHSSFTLINAICSLCYSIFFGGGYTWWESLISLGHSVYCWWLVIFFFFFFFESLLRHF